jgi:hypothetical protein
VAVGQTFVIGNRSWSVVLEREPTDVQATSRFLCELTMAQRGRTVAARGRDAEIRRRAKEVERRADELQEPCARSQEPPY